MIALAVLAGVSAPDLQQVPQQPIAWQGTAVVHAGARDIALGVDSRIEADGRVVSSSWPLEEGRERGERRLIIDPSTRSATLLRSGKQTAMPQAFAVEEIGQFGVYRQYGVAAGQCASQTQTGPASNVIEVHAPGLVPTTFRCASGQVVSAANWVAGSSPQVRQEFWFKRQWRDRGAVFPRDMRIARDGKPFFDLRVTRFSSEVAPTSPRN